MLSLIFAHAVIPWDDIDDMLLDSHWYAYVYTLVMCYWFVSYFIYLLLALKLVITDMEYSWHIVEFM